MVSGPAQEALMSIFAKKPEWEQKVMADVGGAPPLAPSGGGYGISEVVQLLRGLPETQAGQSAELVVRVVRATLASLNVRLADIIDDANRKQKVAHDRIVAVHTQMAELERQLESHRREIATLEGDLKELTAVKERLQHAEKMAAPLAPQKIAPAATSAPNATTPAPQVLKE
jgi:hypothetical protein